MYQRSINPYLRYLFYLPWQLSDTLTKYQSSSPEVNFLMYFLSTNGNWGNFCLLKKLHRNIHPACEFIIFVQASPSSWDNYLWVQYLCSSVSQPLGLLYFSTVTRPVVHYLRSSVTQHVGSLSCSNASSLWVHYVFRFHSASS